MKKYFLVLISFITPFQLSGQESQTFIDFNTFEDQIQETYPNPENQLLSVEGEAIAELGSELFMLDNWSVTLTNASGEDPISKMDSYSKKVTSGEQGTVLGIRVKFPEWPYAGEATITPKFPLLPFTKDGQYANINNGVVTNVGSVKSFSMWSNGRNFPFTVGVRLVDIAGKLTEFPLGSLFYVGWRRLVYNNPTFTTRPLDNIKPNTRIYPSEIPLLRFDQITVYRPGNQDGGEFVGYFGNMDIEYTPYLTEMITDINDEDTWGIIQTQQGKRAANINAALYEEILQYEYAKQRVQAANDANDNVADDEAVADDGQL